jgi:hypothetical protein
MPSVTANTIGAHIQYSRFNASANVRSVGNDTFALFQKSFSIGVGLTVKQWLAPGSLLTSIQPLQIAIWEIITRLLLDVVIVACPE